MLWLHILHRFLEKITYIIDSTDFGFIKIAIGYNCATCNRFIAFPLTSNIQCLPWKEMKLILE